MLFCTPSHLFEIFSFGGIVGVCFGLYIYYRIRKSVNNSVYKKIVEGKGFDPRN